MRREIVIGLAIAASTTTVHAESCSITSLTGLAFGSYDVFDAAPVLSAGSITYECTGVLETDRVVLELDGTPDASTPRTMTASTRTLHYQLYLDAARTLVWGRGSGGTGTHGPARPADGVPTVVHVYGAMPARQNAGIGSYSATVVATLQF